MLLGEVKELLKISWNDEDTNIQGIINRGMSYLNQITGVELDFTVEGQPKALLFDYCRYAYNNASEYFEENFKSEILRLQFKSAVAVMNSENTV